MFDHDGYVFLDKNLKEIDPVDILSHLVPGIYTVLERVLVLLEQSFIALSFHFLQNLNDISLRTPDECLELFGEVEVR